MHAPTPLLNALLTRFDAPGQDGTLLEELDHRARLGTGIRVPNGGGLSAVLGDVIAQRVDGAVAFRSDGFDRLAERDEPGFQVRRDRSGRHIVVPSRRRDGRERVVAWGGGEFHGRRWFHRDARTVVGGGAVDFDELLAHDVEYPRTLDRDDFVSSDDLCRVASDVEMSIAADDDSLVAEYLT